MFTRNDTIKNEIITSHVIYSIKHNINNPKHINPLVTINLVQSKIWYP